jgi:uncharacterized membrane protein
VCARCSGQVIGVLAFVAVYLLHAARGVPLFAPAFQIACALAPLPAAADWLTQSLGRRESTNGVRLISGALLGLAVADALALLLLGQWLYFGAAVLVFGFYVVGLLAVLRATGGWRRVLAEHFPGVDVGPE